MDINKMHFNGRVKIDSIISLQMFSRDGKEGIGEKKEFFFGLHSHRPRVISSRQTIVSVAPLAGEKKRTLDENSSRPESRERRPISRLNQLFRRRSSARCYEHTCSLMFVLCTSRVYTYTRACTQRNLYPVCWRCVCFIGNFRNCVRDA